MLLPCLQHGFIRSVENVIPTNIVNTADGPSDVFSIWQMECHADGKVVYAGDTIWNPL